MSISFLLLFLGFVLLVLGAERLLEGAVSLAARYKVPNVIVGLVVISLCTSAPEFFSSLKATYIAPDIAISNILGSNIFNILGILGFIAILHPISTRPFEYKAELFLLTLAGLLFGFFLNTNLFSDNRLNQAYVITQIEGGILVLTLIGSLLFSALKSKQTNSTAPSLNSPLKELIYISLGVTLLSIGSHFAITHSIIIATHLGWSQNFIGLSLVGVATGLPELVTSLIAIYKKQPDIAIGNIVGSNLFNLLGVIGGVSLIHPISVASKTGHITDLIFSSFCALLLLVTALWKTKISRLTGAIYFLLYISFIGWKL